MRLQDSKQMNGKQLNEECAQGMVEPWKIKNEECTQGTWSPGRSKI